MHILCVANLDAPLKKQKSSADYNAAIRNTYIKENDEVSQKPSDSRKCAHTHTHTHTHAYTHTYMHTRARMHTHLHTHMHTHMHTHTRTRARTHAHTHK